MNSSDMEDIASKYDLILNIDSVTIKYSDSQSVTIPLHIIDDINLYVREELSRRLATVEFEKKDDNT